MKWLKEYPDEYNVRPYLSVECFYDVDPSVRSFRSTRRRLGTNLIHAIFIRLPERKNDFSGGSLCENNEDKMELRHPCEETWRHEHYDSPVGTVSPYFVNKYGWIRKRLCLPGRVTSGHPSGCGGTSVISLAAVIPSMALWIK